MKINIFLIKRVNTILNYFLFNQITNLKGLFEECTQLYSINIINLDTSKVTDMSFMFNKCYKLK